jgi:hypothetical protein
MLYCNTYICIYMYIQNYTDIHIQLHTYFCIYLCTFLQVLLNRLWIRMKVLCLYMIYIHICVRNMKIDTVIRIYICIFLFVYSIFITFAQYGVDMYMILTSIEELCLNIIYLNIYIHDMYIYLYIFWCLSIYFHHVCLIDCGYVCTCMISTSMEGVCLNIIYINIYIHNMYVNTVIYIFWCLSIYFHHVC